MLEGCSRSCLWQSMVLWCAGWVVGRSSCSLGGQSYGWPLLWVFTGLTFPTLFSPWVVNEASGGLARRTLQDLSIPPLWNRGCAAFLSWWIKLFNENRLYNCGALRWQLYFIYIEAIAIPLALSGACMTLSTTMGCETWIGLSVHEDFPVSTENRRSKWQQSPVLYAAFYRQGCCDSKSLGTVWERYSKNDLTASLSPHRH